jgi:hypothetical protein
MLDLHFRSRYRSTLPRLAYPPARRHDRASWAIAQRMHHEQQYAYGVDHLLPSHFVRALTMGRAMLMAAAAFGTMKPGPIVARDETKGSGAASS